MKKGNRKEALPACGQRKPDTSRNGEDRLEEAIEAQRRKERTLFPLRINATTVVYVTRRKATAEYAEEYRRKLEGKR